MNHLYDKLEVSPRVSPEVLKAAYRVLIRKNHPDLGGSTQEAQVLNQAYETLSDPLKRTQYDTRNPQIFEAGKSCGTGDIGVKMMKVQCVECSHTFVVKVRRFSKDVINRICCPECSTPVFHERITREQARRGQQHASEQGGFSQSRASGAAGERQKTNSQNRSGFTTAHAHAKQLVGSLKNKGWLAHKDADGYFDAVLDTSVLLKNYLYIKVFDSLDEKTIEQFYAQCRKRFTCRSNRFLPTGHYFVAVSRSIADQNKVAARSQQFSAAGGLSNCCMIPVEVDSKRVFFHHKDRTSCPEDIATIEKDLF